MAASTSVIGVTDGAASVIWGTLLQRRVPTEMLGRVSGLDFFVSLALLPLSFAIAGPLSKIVSMETIFLGGPGSGVARRGRHRAARMRNDESPTRCGERESTPNTGGSASSRHSRWRR